MSRLTVRASLFAAIALAASAAAGAQQPAPRPAMRDSMHRDMPGDMHHDMNGMDRMGPQGRMRGPGPGAQRMMPRGGIASMLLAQTAALKLTDQQVTRLAALARSAESQEEAMRGAMDSTHRAMMAGMRPGAPMPQPTPAMEARMKGMHEQMHANVRDALAVLTPDQLATAWEEMHGGMGAGMGAGMGGHGKAAPPMRMRRPAPKPE